ncbi:hypothetical protein ABK040_007039 [Willaertia magna]
MSKRKAVNHNDECEEDDNELVFDEEEDLSPKRLFQSIQYTETKFNELPNEMIQHILNFISNKIDGFHFILINKQIFHTFYKNHILFYPMNFKQTFNEYFNYFNFKLDDFNYTQKMRDFKDYNNEIINELKLFSNLIENKKQQLILQNLLQKQRDKWKEWLLDSKLKKETRTKLNNLFSKVEYLKFENNSLNYQHETTVQFKIDEFNFEFYEFFDGDKVNFTITCNNNSIGEGDYVVNFYKDKIKKLRKAFELDNMSKILFLDVLKLLIPNDLNYVEFNF